MTHRLELRRQLEVACRHLLSEQNRDPYASERGCFDRRYWAWKLVDYPEATFQRNVYPLSWLLTHLESGRDDMAPVLREAIEAGITYACRVQHRDGSFDQAFPNEHSFGATAFLLHPLLEAYGAVREYLAPKVRLEAEDSLRRAATFICHCDEKHGHIANHLAGAALALMVASDFFAEPSFAERAAEFLARVLANQSTEGWFVEYEGSDPGYQSLCLHYLAQIYRRQPQPALQAALAKSVEFLSWCVHPDGTFGGDYGSRRTAVFYPGGLALLAKDFPAARSISLFMIKAIAQGRTTTAADIDMGNMAPLLSSYALALDSLASEDANSPCPVELPCERNEARADFPEAGLHFRGTRRYYAVLGASNGGVLKVFDRAKMTLVWNDGGYVGQLTGGQYVTTQMTDHSRYCKVTENRVELEAPLYYMLRSAPTPAQFLLLRVLNLTVMRSISLGNFVKRWLVRLLISGKRMAPLGLRRAVVFDPDLLTVTDTLRLEKKLGLRWLACGLPFVGIHMASANYFEGFSPADGRTRVVVVDVEKLCAEGKISNQVRI